MTKTFKKPISFTISLLLLISTLIAFSVKAKAAAGAQITISGNVTITGSAGSGGTLVGGTVSQGTYALNDDIIINGTTTITVSGEVDVNTINIGTYSTGNAYVINIVGSGGAGDKLVVSSANNTNAVYPVSGYAQNTQSELPRFGIYVENGITFGDGTNALAIDLTGLMGGIEDNKLVGSSTGIIFSKNTTTTVSISDTDNTGAGDWGVRTSNGANAQNITVQGDVTINPGLKAHGIDVNGALNVDGATLTIQGTPGKAVNAYANTVNVINAGKINASSVGVKPVISAGTLNVTNASTVTAEMKNTGTNPTTTGAANTAVYNDASGAVSTISADTGSVITEIYDNTPATIPISSAGTTHAINNVTSAGAMTWTPANSVTVVGNVFTAKLTNATDTLTGTLTGGDTSVTGLGTHVVTFNSALTAVGPHTISLNTNGVGGTSSVTATGVTSLTGGLTANSTTPVTDSTVANNDTISLTTVAPTGYHFSSWAVTTPGANGGTITANLTGTTSFTMDADYTITANFTANANVTATYYYFDGTNYVQSVGLPPETILSGQTPVGGTLTGTEVPAGYTFKGWTTTVGTTTILTAGNAPLGAIVADTNYYAVYTANPNVTATYYYFDGTNYVQSVALSPETILSGQTPVGGTLSGTEVPAGYTFKGWTTTVGTTTILTAGNAPLGAMVSDTNYYAVYTANAVLNVTATYYYFDGTNYVKSVALPPETILSGQTPVGGTLSGTEVPVGFAFTGWTTTVGTTTILTTGNAPLGATVSDTNYYAVYTANAVLNATATYYYFDGTNYVKSALVPPETILSGGTPVGGSLTGAEVPTNYSFAGWTTTVGTTTILTTGNAPLGATVSDTNYYAVYTQTVPVTGKVIPVIIFLVLTASVVVLCWTIISKKRKNRKNLDKNL